VHNLRVELAANISITLRHFEQSSFLPPYPRSNFNWA